MEDNTSNESEQTKSGSAGKIVGIAVAAIVVVAIIGFIMTAYKPKKSDVASANTTSSNDTTTQTPAADSTATFKDGSYDAVGNYQSPEGDESINVHLTLKDGAISDVAVVGNGISPNAKQYQGQFIGAVKSAVVGKKINGLKLSRTAGSSLTPQGFNDALSKIQTQAKS